jgi:hypothetical protein
MFRKSNEKLQQTRELLVELIAELDMVLHDVREAKDLRLGLSEVNGHNGEADGHPDWVEKIARQREALLLVATTIADMQFEWPAELHQEEV